MVGYNLKKRWDLPVLLQPDGKLVDPTSALCNGWSKRYLATFLIDILIFMSFLAMLSKSIATSISP